MQIVISLFDILLCKFIINQGTLIKLAAVIVGVFTARFSIFGTSANTYSDSTLTGKGSFVRIIKN